METTKNKPSHYHQQPYDSAKVQETIFNQVVMTDALDPGTVTTAMWVSFAAKHLLRVGLKDDVKTELIKARNYLNRAITGEWLDD